MRLSCLQENFKRGLDIVGRAVATRTTLPITQDVLLVAEESRLKLCATNLEIAISCWVGAKVEEEGSLAIPARLLSEFVSSLPNDRLDIISSGPANQVQIKCARTEAHISGHDADDFPPIPSVGDGFSVQLDPEVLRKAIGRVVFAAATDESRPVLTGVYTEFEDRSLTMAAADGFRLSVHKVALSEAVPEKISVIVPARAYSELTRLLGDQTDPVTVTISASGTQLLFHLNSADMVSQIIQGTFPNYQQLIPKSHGTRCVADVGEFLRSTKIASVFARDGSGIVRIQMGPSDDGLPGKLVVSARSEEVGDNTGEMDAVVDGDASKIAFNGRYLTDVLAELSTGQVALETTSPSSPGVFRPIGADDYTHVVMPMFVQW
ncbi:MAG: DNA polymerase III subunit beta [Dehalococcoidia bacterium]|nr:DNA polymerase III subunit beta [Dehalococcoidia bacterium]